MQTRDQRYAIQIFETINQQVKPQPREYQNQYGGMAHKLPVLIRTAGLVQALVFVSARGQRAHQALLEHLATTLGYQDGDALVQQSRTAELGPYMVLTRETLDALLWFKRFAQSVLDVEASNAGSEES